MDDGERLARAVLLFYRAGPWTDRDREAWHLLTGLQEASTRVLGDMARRVLPAEEPHDVLAHALARPDWLYDLD
jgi:hypothetical protein